MSKHLRSYARQQFSSSHLIHNAARLLLLALLTFEFLNLIRVLEFTLQFTWRGLFITTAVTWLILESVAYRYFLKRRYMLPGGIWLLALLSLGLDATADIFHFYQRFEWWDQAIHFLNSSLICFAIFIVVSAFWLNRPGFALLHKPARLHLALFISATTTMALSGLYEIEEYTEDMIFGTHRLGPGTDTANDLLCNALGILSAVIVLYLILKFLRKKTRILS